jgi:diguanylate cyclase (GGDEF)-like protein/PAS domain S-box-containing protein
MSADDGDEGERSQLEQLSRLRARIAELEGELARERLQVATIFAHIPAVFYAKDRQGRYVYGSPYVFRLFGASHESAIGKTDRELFSPELAARFNASDRRVLEGEAVESDSYAVPTPTGPRDFTGVRFPIPGPDGVPIGVCGFAVDVTERVAMARELERLARTDPLTGIANRRRFDERFEVEVMRAARSGEHLSLLVCDVDHFKAYNDRYGHQQGDACLERIAKAIEDAVRRPADLAARYGGEEFAVVLPATSPEGAVKMAARIRAAIRGLAIAQERGGQHGFVTISVGVATVIGAFTSAEVLALADRALYDAKAAGRDCEIAVSDEHEPASARRE